jgi:hypothetical protein
MRAEEMLGISREWIDPKSPAHKAISTDKTLSGVLPHIEAAHAALDEAIKPGEVDPRVSEIAAEQLSIDARHDAIIRGVFTMLTGQSQILGEEGPGAELIKLRDALIPDGMKSISKSYRGEEGQALQLDGRLTPELRAELNAFTIPCEGKKKPLLGYVQEWISLGKELGRLETQKTRLMGAPAEETVGAATVTARNQWIRAVNFLLAAAEMAKLDPEVDSMIFSPLRATERLADRRGRGRAEQAPEEQAADAETTADAAEPANGGASTGAEPPADGAATPAKEPAPPTAPKGDTPAKKPAAAKKKTTA